MPVRSWLSVLSGVLWTTACLAAGDQSAARERGSPAQAPDRWADARETMVARQIEARGVRSPAVLAAMRKVARHLFVPAELVRDAYDDSPLPIGFGQTISQPYIVAYMSEVLDVGREHKVLEIGTGSGYQAAVLGELAARVYTIEIVPELGERAARLLSDLGYDNVEVRVGDGYLGWPEEAPFDRIMVTAAPDHVPQPLIDQLKVGGKLIVPVGRGVQDMTIVTKHADRVVTETTIPVRFVPLTRKP